MDPQTGGVFIIVAFAVICYAIVQRFRLQAARRIEARLAAIEQQQALTTAILQEAQQQSRLRQPH